MVFFSCTCRTGPEWDQLNTNAVESNFPAALSLASKFPLWEATAGCFSTLPHPGAFGHVRSAQRGGRLLHGTCEAEPGGATSPQVSSLSSAIWSPSGVFWTFNKSVWPIYFLSQGCHLHHGWAPTWRQLVSLFFQGFLVHLVVAYEHLPCIRHQDTRSFQSFIIYWALHDFYEALCKIITTTPSGRCQCVWVGWWLCALVAHLWVLCAGYLHLRCPCCGKQQHMYQKLPSSPAHRDLGS